MATFKLSLEAAKRIERGSARSAHPRIAKDPFMRLKAIQTPASQEPILDAIWSSNQLKTTPAASHRWDASSTVHLAGEVPVIWMNCGRLELRWVHWGVRDPIEGQGFVDGQKRTYARQCLIPAASVDFDDNGSLWQITPTASNVLLLGAVWRPFNSYAREPHVVDVMTTGPADGIANLVSAMIINVPVDQIEDWLSSERETTSMQRAGAGAPISLSNIGAAA